MPCEPMDLAMRLLKYDFYLDAKRRDTQGVHYPPSRLQFTPIKGQEHPALQESGKPKRIDPSTRLTGGERPGHYVGAKSAKIPKHPSMHEGLSFDNIAQMLGRTLTHEGTHALIEDEVREAAENPQQYTNMTEWGAHQAMFPGGQEQGDLASRLYASHPNTTDVASTQPQQEGIPWKSEPMDLAWRLLKQQGQTTLDDFEDWANKWETTEPMPWVDPAFSQAMGDWSQEDIDDLYWGVSRPDLKQQVQPASKLNPADLFMTRTPYDESKVRVGWSQSRPNQSTPSGYTYTMHHPVHGELGTTSISSPEEGNPFSENYSIANTEIGEKFRRQGLYRRMLASILGTLPWGEKLQSYKRNRQSQPFHESFGANPPAGITAHAAQKMPQPIDEDGNPIVVGDFRTDDKRDYSRTGRYVPGYGGRSPNAIRIDGTKLDDAQSRMLPGWGDLRPQIGESVAILPRTAVTQPKWKMPFTRKPINPLVQLIRPPSVPEAQVPWNQQSKQQRFDVGRWERPRLFAEPLGPEDDVSMRTLPMRRGLRRISPNEHLAGKLPESVMRERRRLLSQ